MMNKNIKDIATKAGFIIVEGDDRIMFDEGNNIITSCYEAHALISLMLDDIKKILNNSLKHPDIMGNEWDHGYDDGITSALSIIEKHFSDE